MSYSVHLGRADEGFLADLNPHSFKTESKTPLSIQEIKNAISASPKFDLALFTVLPWEATSKAGQPAEVRAFAGFFKKPLRYVLDILIKLLVSEVHI